MGRTLFHLFQSKQTSKNFQFLNKLATSTLFKKKCRCLLHCLITDAAVDLSLLFLLNAKQKSLEVRMFKWWWYLSLLGVIHKVLKMHIQGGIDIF